MIFDTGYADWPELLDSLRGLGYDGQTLVVRRRNYAGLAARRGDYGEIATETVRPGYREIGGNPRAASAKMRWAMEC